MKTKLIEFIKVKIADVEKSIRAREQIQSCLLGGTDESWEAVSKMHPSTAGKPMRKAERIDLAAREGRILVKLRSELANFNAVLEELLHHESPCQN